MIYTVWLLTRPLSYAISIRPLATLSFGKHHLCHWGLLVSEMTILDAKVIFLRTLEYGANDDTELGTMYDLCRDEKSRNMVNVKRPFRVSHLRTEWNTFTAQYVGETKMKYGDISIEGDLSLPFVAWPNKSRSHQK
jgi:hypothetical protein